jgi:hypothetical protein
MLIVNVPLVTYVNDKEGVDKQEVWAAPTQNIGILHRLCGSGGFIYSKDTI